MTLEAKSLMKAVVPSTLIPNPSPGNLQPTRLALHVSEDGSSCWAYVASGCHIYKLKIPLEDSFVSKGKESLLIPVLSQVMDSFLVTHCPHRSEIQSIVLTETESTGHFLLGSVDSYGHLIVSKLDPAGEDVNRLMYSVLPRDGGVGEGSWAGLCFSPAQWSMAAVARSFCKTVDVYDQDIHVRTLHTSSTGNIAVGGADRTVTVYDPRRWASLSRWVHCSKYEITGLAFSSIDPDHIYIQGVDYEVFCGQWKENTKVFSFRGDSNWLGFSKCHKRDVMGGWCDSGSIFVADVVAKESEINTVKGFVNGFS